MFIFFQQPQLHNYLSKQNYVTILLISFALIFTYYQMYLTIHPVVETVYSKHDYLSKQLHIEKEEHNKFMNELRNLRIYYSNNISKNDVTCQICWIRIFNLNLEDSVTHILENNRHAQKAYYDTLFPLQRLLIAICFLNTFCIIIIFNEPQKLFIISILLTVICICMSGEGFTEDNPSICYILTTVGFVFSFSIFVVFKILLTLLNIVYYQKIREILLSEWLYNLI